MEVAAHEALKVVDPSQVAASRQVVRAHAERVGFSEVDAHRAGIVATELASNLIKHTPAGGELLLRAVAGPPAELELFAIDRGPGMRDVQRSLADGHSTAGSPGTGLGAIRRLSDDFDIHSQADNGTVIWTRFRADRAAAISQSLTVHGISVPLAGEVVCGDSWCVQARPSGAAAMVVDGLGHGMHAADAALAAAASFARNARSASQALEAVHAGLRHTRGAAAAIAEVNRERQTVIFAGVGNVSGAIVLNGTVRHAVSHNGTLGHEARYFREYAYPWLPGSILIMHSDGLATHWSLDAYPGLAQRRAAVIAAVLYRDHSRQRDDVTVVVGRSDR